MYLFYILLLIPLLENEIYFQFDLTSSKQWCLMRWTTSCCSCTCMRNPEVQGNFQTLFTMKMHVCLCMMKASTVLNVYVPFYVHFNPLYSFLKLEITICCILLSLLFAGDDDLVFSICTLYPFAVHADMLSMQTFLILAFSTILII